VGTYCYVAVCRRGRLGGARPFDAHRGRRGAGHIVAADHLQLVLVSLQILLMLLLLGFVLYLSTVLEPFPGRTTFPKLLQVYSFPKEVLFAFSALTL